MPYKDKEAQKAYNLAYGKRVYVKAEKNLYYKAHRDAIRRKFREYYLKHKEGWYNPAQTKEYRRKLRMAALTAYANPPRCACCGEEHLEFLCIDHIGYGRGNPKAEPTEIGSKLYIKLKRLGYPEGFRVLCQNCNSSLGMYGYCPHEGDNNES